MANPYNFSKPVSGRDFYDRDEVIDKFFDLSEKNMAIIGIRRMGKSSVLEEIKRSAEKDTGHRGRFIVCTIDFELLSKIVGDARSRIKEILLKKKIIKEGFKNQQATIPDQTLEAFFRRAARIAESQNKTLVLLCDETQHVEDLGETGEIVCNAMKVVSEECVNFRVAVASTPLFYKLSPLKTLINSSEQRFCIGVFEKDCQRDYPIELAQLTKTEDEPPLPSTVIKKVVKISGGHPYFIQKLCSICFANKESVEEEIAQSPRGLRGLILKLFSRAWFKILSDAEKEICEGDVESDQFEEDIKSFKDEDQNILKVLSEKKSRINTNTISKAAKVTSYLANRRLVFLQRLGLVNNRGKQWRITNKIFRDWLCLHPSETVVKRLKRSRFIAWLLLAVTSPWLLFLWLIKVIPAELNWLNPYLAIACASLMVSIIVFNVLDRFSNKVVASIVGGLGPFGLLTVIIAAIIEYFTP
jgi:hypothetical protein